MTVNSTTNRVSYTGNGTANPLAVSFPFQAQADLVVVRTAIVTGVQTTLVLNSDYTITGTTDANGYYSSGGNVVPASSITTDYTWTIYRSPTVTQAVQHVDNDPLPAASIDGPLDKLTMIAQRHGDLLGRALVLPDGDPAQSMVLPSQVARAGKVAGYDAITGAPVVSQVNLADIDSLASSVTTAEAAAAAAVGAASVAGSDLWSRPTISTLNTPPGSPTVGDRYLVGTSPTGAWASYPNQVAQWNGLLWVFSGAPSVGQRLAVGGATYAYGASSAWQLADISLANYASVSAAIAALPTSGGRLRVGGGAQTASSSPTIGSKSIQFDIDPSAVFSGAGIVTGGFLSMVTNQSQRAIGPYILSQGAQPSYVTPILGGVSAFNVERIVPGNSTGQEVAIYAGAQSASNVATAGAWAGNFLNNIKSGFAGNGYGIEIDINVDTSGVTGNVRGLQLNGEGGNPTTGIEMTRNDSSYWQIGYRAVRAQMAFRADKTSVLDYAFFVNGPIFTSGTNPVIISASQLSNGGDTIVLSRNTETSPSGYFLRLVNTNNTASLLSVDVGGNLLSAGAVSAGTFLRALPTTVGLLPSPVVAGAGAIAYVQDAMSSTFHAIVAGGGATDIMVVSDGTNWRIGG